MARGYRFATIRRRGFASDKVSSRLPVSALSPVTGADTTDVQGVSLSKVLGDERDGHKQTTVWIRIMKLWLLRGDSQKYSHTFSYDCAHGFVVRAATEDDARRIAGAQAGDEGQAVWLDTKRVMCTEISSDGPSEVILTHFVSG